MKDVVDAILAQNAPRSDRNSAAARACRLCGGSNPVLCADCRDIFRAPAVRNPIIALDRTKMHYSARQRRKKAS